VQVADKVRFQLEMVQKGQNRILSCQVSRFSSFRKLFLPSVLSAIMPRGQEGGSFFGLNLLR
jgi:hypothetical protein